MRCGCGCRCGSGPALRISWQLTTTKVTGDHEAGERCSEDQEGGAHVARGCVRVERGADERGRMRGATRREQLETLPRAGSWE